MGQGFTALRRRWRDEESAAVAVHDARDAAEQDGPEIIAEEDYVPLKKRRRMAASHQRQPVDHNSNTITASTSTVHDQMHELHEPSLVVKPSQLKEDAPVMTETEAFVRQEEEMIARSSEKKHLDVQLRVSPEVVQDISYTEPMQTGWKRPFAIRSLGKVECDDIRRRWHILVEDEDIPSPIPGFKDMRLPEPLLAALKAKHIAYPTLIQVQGLPVILSGRDMIGIASTGSGKTLAFALPLICFAMQEEVRMPLMGGEGPVGLVVCPTRELARQTLDVVGELTSGYPQLRSVLCIDGVDVRSQLEVVKQGVHIVVATPGLLKDMLVKTKMNLNNCKYLALDEADRLLDSGFEDDIREILRYFRGQRQTVLFSATMSKRIQRFSESALVKPVVVNVGQRAGAAHLDLVQEVECVKQEAKMVYLLVCLEKTPPPVLSFCQNKADVDAVHEYLLLKGVEVAGIHGGKDQEQRESAISSFKAGDKDILVATDVASKDLDFPDIQHVINYDMPAEIENYVHRIGRTGRCGKTGLATSFINKSESEKKILLDLKHLLKEAKQRMLPVLATLDDPVEVEADNDELAKASGVQG